MPIREIKLKSYKEQIFELFSEGAQPPRSSIQGWLEPPSPHVVGAYVSNDQFLFLTRHKELIIKIHGDVFRILFIPMHRIERDLYSVTLFGWPYNNNCNLLKPSPEMN